MADPTAADERPEAAQRMRQDRFAGVASTFPAASLARTRNVCRPRVRFRYVRGERHACHARPSSLHRNVEPASVETNLKVARLDVVGLAGPRVMRVPGGVASTAGGVGDATGGGAGGGGVGAGAGGGVGSAGGGAGGGGVGAGAGGGDAGEIAAERGHDVREP